ncbi:hypothetical protein [Curtobacterium sp. MCBD17_021]|uniref:hypothetical protein n=1 Tax=Curtobacterium sp. MCBD17_021 TaxID=2175665 RepID=UPI000DB617A6|nr:hypothetical protein [Curtobacterium sp. MCBD17_021]PZE66902.1 hypothetical protein DEI83_06220 [Curtobacterium sp. MCBD17_021]
MSGIATTISPTCYGPRKLSRLDLMGIRFVDDPNDPTGGSGAGGGTGYKAPESQEELDRIITARLQRQEASLNERYKDFDSLKSKAEQFDRLQQSGAGSGQPADVTAQLQQFEQRVTAAETTATQTQTQLTETQTELARKDVALDKGIAKEQLPLLTATTKEELEKQADAILALTRGSGRVPGQGGGGGNAPSGLDAGRAEWEKRHPKKN